MSFIDDISFLSNEMLDEVFSTEAKVSGRFQLKPHQSVGKIVSGMSRPDIIGLYGEPNNNFRKTKTSSSSTDDYSLFHVYYTSKGIVKGVEFFPECVITYKGKNLFQLSKSDLTSLGAKKTGGSYEIESLGVTMNKDSVYVDLT